MNPKLKIVFLGLALVGRFAWAAADPLPGTKALDWPEDDLSGRMMDGAHRFVEGQIANAKTQRGRFWKYDSTSAETWEKAIAENRQYLKRIIGAVDARLSPRMERFGDDASQALVAETTRYRIYQVRWAVLEGLPAEGLLVQPNGTAVGHLVVLPDSNQTPEQLLGLRPGLAPDRQFARRLAENGFELVIPV